MNLVIQPLSPERADDFFDFFDNHAFTDASPYRCYCQIYQMSRAQYHAEYDSVEGSNLGRVSREIAARQIASCALRGYLAYVDGESIGWCNANDRANYPADAPYGEHFHAPAENREIAVVCFEIAPEYRGKGVATALLNRVIADARENGYAAVVSFPVRRDERYEWDCLGPIRLYEKVGFLEAEECGAVLMRKSLI